jgi:hypothetical protein
MIDDFKAAVQPRMDAQNQSRKQKAEIGKAESGNESVPIREIRV